jgi:hypothetical protein
MCKTSALNSLPQGVTEAARKKTACREDPRKAARKKNSLPLRGAEIG